MNTVASVAWGQLHELGERVFTDLFQAIYLKVGLDIPGICGAVLCVVAIGACGYMLTIQKDEAAFCFSESVAGKDDATIAQLIDAIARLNGQLRSAQTHCGDILCGYAHANKCLFDGFGTTQG